MINLINTIYKCLLAILKIIQPLSEGTKILFCFQSLVGLPRNQSMNGLYPPIVESRPRGGSANSLFVLATEERPLVGRSALRGFNSAGSKPPESSQVPFQVLS